MYFSPASNMFSFSAEPKFQAEQKKKMILSYLTKAKTKTY
jgi:hypothetical protein